MTKISLKHQGGNIFCVSLNCLHAKLVTFNKRTSKRTINYNINQILSNEDSNVKFAITALKNTPHYKFLLNKNDKSYEKYLTNGGKFVGNGLEHSLKIYKSLINNFNGYPYLNQYIKCYVFKGKLCIMDGLHRANLLLFKGETTVPIFIVNGLRLYNNLKNKRH